MWTPPKRKKCKIKGDEGVTYEERPKMKRDAWLKAVFFMGKIAVLIYKLFPYLNMSNINVASDLNLLFIDWGISAFNNLGQNCIVEVKQTFLWITWQIFFYHKLCWGCNCYLKFSNVSKVCLYSSNRIIKTQYELYVKIWIVCSCKFKTIF